MVEKAEKNRKKEVKRVGETDGERGSEYSNHVSAKMKKQLF